MNESKYTPGPWDYHRVCAAGSPGELVYCLIFSGPKHLAFSGTYIKDRRGELTKKRISSEEAEANARLIAAAPELLEALHAIMDCLGPSGYHPAAGFPACEKARAAIAKAEKP